MKHEINPEELTILVVDDDKFMLGLIKDTLQSLGIRNLHQATDPVEAFKELKLSHVDLIITDWHMEPLNGLEFVRLVRQANDSPNKVVPIILLTGHTEMHRVIEARDTGVNEVLAKPISAEKLGARIDSIFENPRPFIRTKDYFGPDRRRKDLGPPRGKGDRRTGLAS